jgi:hypothetical protein
VGVGCLLHVVLLRTLQPPTGYHRRLFGEYCCWEARREKGRGFIIYHISHVSSSSFINHQQIIYRIRRPPYQGGGVRCFDHDGRHYFPFGGRHSFPPVVMIGRCITKMIRNQKNEESLVGSRIVEVVDMMVVSSYQTQQSTSSVRRRETIIPSSEE